MTHLKNAREQNLVAKIKGTTVEIDGHIYSANDLKVSEETSEKNMKSNDSADENQEEKSYSPIQQSGSFGSQQKTPTTGEETERYTARNSTTGEETSEKGNYKLICIVSVF
ncbi:hypothetical protein JTB14_004475 [Gonioctena quinquepunctata]|nr:hypothetical protein JTB14_004475 [Gonioctena quinquepunctata]